jgi:hypothetical protein
VADVPPTGDQAYAYGPVPPLTFTDALPFEPPLHETLVCASAVKAKALGSVIMKERVAVQPLASVTVTVYVPATRPVIEEAVPPEGDHE